jgi:predicted HNH restriction endonuclease
MLELHHLEEHAEGGPNVKENLVCLCSRCHDDVHAGRIQLPPGLTG